MSRIEAGSGRCSNCSPEGRPNARRKIPPCALDRNAKDGRCATCSLIRDVVGSFAPVVAAELEKVGLGGTKSALNSIIVKYRTGSFIKVCLCYDLLDCDDGRMLIPLDIFLDAEKLHTLPPPPHIAPVLCVSRNIPSRLDIPWVTNLTRTWIQQCDESHMACAVSSNPSLPTRVLDLGNPGAENGIKLKLSNDERGQYIALSYRWGANAIRGSTLLTTTSCLADHLIGIPWKDIPQTFRDAIELSWALGIRYLWIDSLCILQDDTVDWDTESASMAKVYENSFLTIAATAGLDNCAKMLTERWTQFESSEGRYTIQPSITSVPVTRRVSPGAAGHLSLSPLPLFVRYELHTAHNRFVDGDNAQQHTADSPLLTRAWSFQERLLAPRTLHFHAEEMVWECKTDMRCECGRLEDNPRSFPKRYPVRRAGASSYASSIPPSRAWLKSSLTWAMLNAEDLFHLVWIWIDLVSEYLQLKLTYEKDRLPALSGLASSFARPELGRYLAGMWEAALPEGLLFTVDYEENPRAQTPLVARLDSQSTPASHAALVDAPTWSWSSIAFDHGTVVSFAAILHAQGQSGRNWIRCKDFCLIDSRVDPMTSNPFGWTTGKQLTIRGLLGDCSELIRNLVGNRETAGQRAGISFFSDQRFEIGFEGGSHPKICYLHVGQVNGDRDSNDLTSDHPCLGLVIQRVSVASHDNTYRRLGVLVYGEHTVSCLKQLEAGEIRLV
ncbi:heterokaryon incompatibility protein-domain-containing protein [Immersiella caudata]|uniref:Heterokaryon incompatibility protein-domain-containing protein n=1 Tax=Immersiella caudata TaxID=314043 RepID=A0AA39WT03_9PEZI|nr:heterokaryon incompatibility protein-domain-containing protein [Immersiella caudata]